LLGPVYEFGEFRLDCGAFELLRQGQPLRVERKPMELLILLASLPGQLVTRTEIAERLWPSEVFVDTEHGINTAIRKLRYALRDDAEESKFIQTVTGKGYRFIMPLTVIAPQGPRPVVAPLSQRDESRAAPASTPKDSRARSRASALTISAVAVVLLAVAIAAFLRWTQSRSHAAIESLAVIPLDNLSGDPAQDYLADGMTDELTTMLAKDSTLRIISRTSVMQYKHAHRPLKDIALALGADGIVEGSVARSGDHIHLNLQLIQAATDSHLWAESYDRDAQDVALSNDAARAIASRLHSATPTAAPLRVIDPAAHDAYLHGRYLWLSSRDDESGPYFKKATEIQPDYAAAWAGLADYYGKGVVAGELDPRTALPLQEQASARALVLDPNLAEAHAAMAGTYLVARWDPTNADREILRAISLDPSNGDLYAFRADVKLVEDRRPETIELAKKAIEMAPLEHAPWLGWIYMDQRQYDAALDDLKVRLQATPSDPSLLYCRLECLRRKGSYKEATDAAAKLFASFNAPHDASAIRAAFAKGGWPAVVRWQLAFDSARQKKQYVSPVLLATYRAELGESEPTLSLLEEAFRQHDFAVVLIATDPAFDFLHSDPRFQSLVQRIGLPVTSIATSTP
jgi:TolB-like protein/DNA-binding winged helix-turn-helix (wHTH) protein